MNRILFKNDEGGVSVIIPSDNALAEHTIQEIAEKDVPAGKPYKIVSVDDIPSDRNRHCETQRMILQSHRQLRQMS